MDLVHILSYISYLLWEDEDIGEGVAVHQHAQKKHRAAQLAKGGAFRSATLLQQFNKKHTGV